MTGDTSIIKSGAVAAAERYPARPEPPRDATITTGFDVFRQLPSSAQLCGLIMLG